MTNDKEFREWLEAQSRETCVAIAYRTAMRVLPLVTRIINESPNDSLMLVSLRCALIAGLHGSRRDTARSQAPKAAEAAKAIFASSEMSSDTVVAYGAASAACGTMAVIDQHEDRSSSASGAIFYAKETMANLAGENAYWEDFILEKVETGDRTETEVYKTASLAAWTSFSELVIADGEILASELMRSKITDRSGQVYAVGSFSQLRDSGSLTTAWDFWAKWYNRAMAGDPLPWDLQEAVALIPEEVWEAGPEAVAAEIARIEAEFELRQRIADFEAGRTLLEDQRLGIGGNNPPEEIDDPVVGEQVVILWESIAGLKEEVEADAPDAERVARLTDVLVNALKAILAWCGRKGDLTVDTTIKWVIPAGGGGYFLVNPSKAEAVLKAAQAWLPFLLP